MLVVRAVPQARAEAWHWQVWQEQAALGVPAEQGVQGVQAERQC